MTEQRTWPADAVERRSVAALVPYARNARTHGDGQVAQIAASIREWGWTCAPPKKTVPLAFYAADQQTPRRHPLRASALRAHIFADRQI